MRVKNLLYFFAEIKDFNRKIFLITADCEIKIDICCVAEVGKHLKELRKLFIFSANNLKGCINKNISYIIVTCANTCEVAIESLVASDSICICF